jgi:hypothetical protein
MPLKLGATTLTDVKYNGVSLTKVTYNGTVVYQPFIYYGYGEDINLYKYNINLSTLVATGNGNSFQFYNKVQYITADADFLYTYNDSTLRIHKIQKTIPSSQVAQTSSTFNMQTENPAIFLDGTNIYALRFSDRRRLSRYLTSTLAVAQTGNTSFPSDIKQIMVDSTHVYVGMNGNTRVSRIDKNNLSASVQSPTDSFATSFSWTMDNNFVYGIRNDGNRFYRITKSNWVSGVGFISVGLGLSLTSVDENNMVAVDASHLYFIGEYSSSSIGVLVRTNLSGGEVTVSTFVFPEDPRRIQLFGNKIYIGCNNRTFVIMDKSNINSGTATQVANPNTGADIVGLLVE